MVSGQAVSEPIPDFGAGSKGKAAEPHPAGRIRYGTFIQVLRMVMFLSWFFVVAIITQITQFLGTPLYLINRDYYYAYMALTKQSFGIFITTITQWFSPTVVRVSGDKSVRGQLLLTKYGGLQTDFPERLIMIANHQIYTDWLYLWWVAYTNKMHGHIFIVLKETLKYVPIIGPGMMFYGFIFMARNWQKDKPRMEHRLRQLRASHGGPMSGSQSLDPMWLLLYPEGTNLSANTRRQSSAWAAKTGIKDFEHVLLPRALGFQYCLQQLSGTVDWVYDCTVAYEGIPRGAYGQDIFTLRSSFFQGRPPKSVNMFWRRIAVSSIPVDDLKQFEVWLKGQWQVKEDLLEGYAQNGRFPADDGQDSEGEPALAGSSGSQMQKGAGFIETKVMLAHTYEVGQIFVVFAAFLLVCNVFWKLYIMGRQLV